MAATIKTSRGNYTLGIAGPPELDAGALVLTLVLERSDGIERVAFRCRVADQLLGGPRGAEEIVARLAPWIERGFEMTRENALKTIRSERKMMEIVFNKGNPGPFR